MTKDRDIAAEVAEGIRAAIEYLEGRRDHVVERVVLVSRNTGEATERRPDGDDTR